LQHPNANPTLTTRVTVNPNRGHPSLAGSHAILALGILRAGGRAYAARRFGRHWQRTGRKPLAEELKQAYVRTATLKGLPRRTVVIQHVLRNALLPTITVIAISFGWLISGLVVVENVFNYPGMGRLFVFAVNRRDLPLIQAITMVTVIGFSSANLVADLLYAVLNPEIRLGA
jgi:ABC-type dipeptide/oligopeptide/nickel transport system permease component